MSDLNFPLHSLEKGNWFKLICGASFQHLPAIRSLTLAYTLAGVDCIDVAADSAVVLAVQEAFKIARAFAEDATVRGFPWQGLPWLMVSLNDGEDPHFRKAEFDSNYCPSDCSRPCEGICPAQAISFADVALGKQTLSNTPDKFAGVIDQLCYGCGRCLPVCPSELIYTRSYVLTPEAIASLIKEFSIDAIEIHTQVGHWQDFKRLWQSISPWVHQLKLLAISCPDDPDLINYLHSLYDLINPLPCLLIWQTDGRPMSGDIGIGTTHASIKLAQKVLATDLPGYIQLAGGTNQYTVTKLRSLGLLQDKEKNNQKTRKDIYYSSKNKNYSFVSGIAYGSYARSLLSPIIEKIDHLEGDPNLLWQAVNKAHFLVSQLKPTTRFKGIKN